MGKRKTHEEFLEDLKVKNPKAYEELEFLEEYKRHEVKIKAEDRYGIVYIRPSDLLRGGNTSIEGAIDKTEYYKNKASEVHNGKYTYEKLVYDGYNSNITITCTKHGEFTQKAHIHIRGHGCKKCKNENVSTNMMNTQDFFKEKANIVHNDKYDYSSVNYKGKGKKVKIICPIHGEFKQNPMSHLGGNGCKKCSDEKSGWTRGSWVNAGKESEDYTQYKLYKIKICSEDEEFYKIGITYTEIEKRFKREKKFVDNYHYEIIEIIKSDDGNYIWNLEKQLHRKYREYKYIPKFEFGGHTECFSYIGID